MRKSHPLFRISQLRRLAAADIDRSPGGVRMNSATSDKVFAALETFRIELPSWGFATPALVSES